jgi:hypothetical protein
MAEKTYSIPVSNGFVARLRFDRTVSENLLVLSGYGRGQRHDASVNCKSRSSRSICLVRLRAYP